MNDIWIWIISALAIAGVLTRPLKSPEWIWAVAGALALAIVRLETTDQVLHGLRSGIDVYLFLIGMMALSEISREEGVFDWVADFSCHHAKGSSQKLFTFMFFAGTIVTIFLSNDATAVVLTPAVYQAVKRAGAKPKPFLFICALIANAASFVLPISNPANLVVYGKNLPALPAWLGFFLLPSIASIAVTYLVARVWFRRDLEPRIEISGETKLKGRVALVGLAATSFVLIACSILKTDLGAPTFACAFTVLILISLKNKQWPVKAVKQIAWSVIPLVAGLFVIVEALNTTQLLPLARRFFEHATTYSAAFTVAIVSNIANNLPVGLMTGLAVTENVKHAVLIGVDLGPNLSVTGSLATILWLMAIRREGENVSAKDFFYLGCVIMPLSLAAALACV